MPSTPVRRPMAVLQLIPSLDSGGAERTAIDIAEALVRRGDRALVASAGGRLEGELKQVGGQLVRLPLASKNPATMASNAVRLARLIGRERVDLVHARSRAPAWSGLAACRASGTPFVTTFHGIYAESNCFKRFYNSVMVRGAAVIANSHYTARLIGERYGVPVERIAIIPRGTDLTSFDSTAVSGERQAVLRATWGVSASDRIVLQLARLAHWKGQAVLIEAAARQPLAGRGDVSVVLAGDEQGRTRYLEELRDMVVANDLEGRVRIVGHCADAPAAMALACVAVIASTEAEAFGRTAIEAAAMGVPVVAAELGATGETVLAPPRVPEEQRTGWLVPPGDAPALAQAIDAALSLSPLDRRLLAERARRHAEAFTTAPMQDATLALYDRLLQPSGPADSFLKR